ncbi:hypothetical protein B0H13DRAFT_2328626 [Mycena leptocephala]|nr:hypothetical protein B0H13DRAFT_2328626 [Mycena leptocephala]
MFSDSSNVPIAEEQSDEYNYLECIGPPYDTRSAPSKSVVGNEFLQGIGSTGEGLAVHHCIYIYMKSDQVSQFHSTGLRLSQELPPLPAPPSISSPSHTEAEDLPVNDMDPEYESEVAHRDINLKLNESNIVPGKPMRTVSNRATEGVAARRAPVWPVSHDSRYSCDYGDRSGRRGGGTDDDYRGWDDYRWVPENGYCTTLQIS